MRKLISMLLPLAVVVGGCGGGDSGVEAGANTTTPLTGVTTTAHATTTSKGPITTEPTATTTITAPPIQQPTMPLETELTRDLMYHPPDDRFVGDSGLTDVIAPTEGGPWPTVVVFHGDPRGTSKTWHRPDATKIAERGAVVFLPSWGHTPVFFAPEALDDTWDMIVREVTCAVSFARARTGDYGGDPDNITLYGLSAGGNAVLMAGLAGAEPLDTCSAPGGAVTPRVLAPIDADWVLGGDWDSELSTNPEAFYSFTPWRYLDGSQKLSIYVMVTEDQSLIRSTEPDPASSWLSYRHPDIDLAAQLEAMGFLDDGKFGLVESGEYAYQVLLDAGYDATFVSLPGARHSAWGEEGLRVVVETVVNAAWSE